MFPSCNLGSREYALVFCKHENVCVCVCVFIYLFIYPSIMIFCYLMHILNIVVDGCEYKCGIETQEDWVEN